ncbi:MAG: polysaccharide deacetylase family protein [Gemmatimonadota bacterium]
MRAILTYHSIDPSGSAISVDPGVFGRHIRWLASGRVRVVSLAQLAELPPNADAVALTFDDAFENFGDLAAPLLREYRLPATLFVVPGHVGGTNAWGGVLDQRVPTLPLLDWAALGRLAEDGVTLGAHTLTHPHLTALSGDELERELAGAASRIASETGMTPADVAYPFGDVNAIVAERAGRIFQRGCTTDLRALRAVESPMLLPRLDMFYLRAPGQLERWGTATFERHLWLRSQARRLRRVLAPAGKSW